jgi:hypothetical protein
VNSSSLETSHLRSSGTRRRVCFRVADWRSSNMNGRRKFTDGEEHCAGPLRAMASSNMSSTAVTTRYISLHDRS